MAESIRIVVGNPSNQTTLYRPSHQADRLRNLSPVFSRQVRRLCFTTALMLFFGPVAAQSQQFEFDARRSLQPAGTSVDPRDYDFTVDRRDFEGVPLEERLNGDSLGELRRKWLIAQRQKQLNAQAPNLPPGLLPNGDFSPDSNARSAAALLPSNSQINRLPGTDSRTGLPARFSFPEQNFELKAPGPEWEHLPFLQRLNPDAVVALGVRFEEQYLQVIAEQIGMEADINTKTLQQISVENMRQVLADVRPSKPQPLQIDGLDGLKTTVTGQLKVAGSLRPITYITWVCMHNGVGWQLISWAPPAFAHKLDETWETIPRCFRLLDHNRVVKTTRDFSTRLYSTRFGVEADLSGTQFFVTPELFDKSDDSRLIAIGGVDSFLGVYPYALPQNPPSRKTIVEGLLTVFEADVDKARLKARRVQHGSLEAIEYHEQPTAAEPDRRRFFRICFAESYAWLIHGSTNTHENINISEWTTAADRIQLTPPLSVDFAQLTEMERSRHVALYFQLGLISADQGQIDRMAEYTLLAHTVSPDDLSVREAVIDRLIAARKFETAMPLLEDLPPGIAIDPDRRAQQAWTLSEVGRKEEALLKYEALFQANYERQDHLALYTELLSDAGRTDDALAIVDRQIKTSPSIDLAVARAQILIAADRKDEAVADLRSRRDSSALAGDEYSIALIDVLLQADHHQEALSEAVRLEKSGEATPQLLMLKGLAEFKLERYVDARKTFETTLEMAPNLTMAKQFLELVSSRLGQGDVSAVLEKLDPVPLPSEVTIRHPAPASLREDDNYWLELDAWSIAFKPGEEFRRTRSQVIHVLNRNAVEALGRLQFDFDSLSEQFYVNRVEVFDETGERIGATDPRDCFILANENDGLATNKKTLNVPIPGLRPGCRIEYQVTWQQYTAPDKFPSRRYATAKQSPTSQVVVSVSGDLSTFRWTGPQPKQISNGFLWNMPATRRNSENMIDDLTVSPDTICLGDGQQSWQQIGQEYVSDIRDRMDLSQRAKKIVMEQLPDKDSLSTSKQVDRLTEWVRRELTYQGIEFGQRAWVMPPIEETLRNRYGDCKDHSLLLWQLLQAAGIKSHLALINVGEPLELRLPSAGQFNHMIVYVEDDLGARFIDCTDKDVAGATRVPMGLALNVALVLDPENARLIRLPDYPDDYNRVWVDRSVTLDENGTAKIDETLWFGGYMASFMRQMMTSGDREDQKSIVRSLLPTTANASITNLQFENPDDLSQQPVLRVSYSTPHFISAVPGQLVGRVNVLDGLGGISMPTEETREQPFRVRMPLDTTARIRIQAPNGFTVSASPERQAVQTKVLEAVRESLMDDDTLEMRFRLRRRTARLQPSAWTSWRTTCQQVNDLLTPNLLLTK
ncbi:MAG: DUF3857 domain-containing protein [Rhodopirellula sp.]|nr:DUF3857 domain-containing protein [Rhodopirellula sp.]